MKTNTLFLFCLLTFSIQSFPQTSWPNMIRVYYKTATDQSIDNIVIRYSADSTVTLEESTEWDARSLNCCDFIASMKGDVNFAIQTRPMGFDRDTVRLRVESTTTGSFKLVFANYQYFTEAKQIFLLDQFTNTQQEVKTNPVYLFNITSDTSSEGANRFKLVFVAEQLAIRCPQNIAANNAAGLAGAYVNYEMTATAKCSAPVYTYSHLPGSFFPLGATTVNVSASDSCGNQSACSFTVTVNDVEAPVIQAPQAVSDATDPGMDYRYLTITAPAVSDNSGQASVTGSRSDGDQLSDSYPVGNTIITWTATDAAGNSSSVTQVITITDNEAPSITVANATLPMDAGKSYTTRQPVYATATDNVQLSSLTGSRSDGQALAAAYPKGITLIEWTATDVNGNIATALQQVNVVDTEAPVITPVSSAVQAVNFTGCSYRITDNSFDPNAVDNAGTVTLINNYNNTSSLAGAVFQPGQSQVIWTATDEAGNSSSWTQVVDVASPQIDVTVPDAVALSQGADPNTIYIGYTPAAALNYSAVAAETQSYAWSTGAGLSITGAANQSAVQVTATATSTGGTLYLTATNVFGCTASVEKQVQVVNVICGPKNDKVVLCHSSGTKQVCVLPSAVNNYLQKGYKLGACNTTTARRNAAEMPAAVTSFKVFPNPGTGLYMLQVNNSEASHLKMVVVDMMGKVIISREVGQVTAQVQLDLQRYPAGIYQLQLINAGQVTTAKIVKL